MGCEGTYGEGWRVKELRVSSWEWGHYPDPTIELVAVFMLARVVQHDQELSIRLL